MVFFPLTLPPTPTILPKILPGILWTALLLSLLLTAEKLFQHDYADGVIEQWLASGITVTTVIMAKISAYWLLNAGSILLLCPIIGILFGLNLHQIIMIMILLIASTPCISFLCALAAAFSMSIARPGAIMALILLPLSLPIMIFGSSGVSAVLIGTQINAELAILTALSLLAASLLPYAIATVIRIGCAE